MNSKNVDVIANLLSDSVYFKVLEPSVQSYVAEYCLNGFNSKLAANSAKVKDAQKVATSEAVQEAIKEFMKYVLADKADKLEAKIMDTLWRRAFYDPFKFIDEEGQPRFDVKNYQKELGADAVVVEGIKRMVHPKNQDNVWMQVDLANRAQALKELLAYSPKEADGEASSFIVNLNVHQREVKQIYEIKDYQDVIEAKK